MISVSHESGLNIAMAGEGNVLRQHELQVMRNVSPEFVKLTD